MPSISSSFEERPDGVAELGGGVNSYSSKNRSFYEIDQYRKSIRRIDDGLKSCHDFVQMMKERGELDLLYAKHLRQWARRWHDVVDQSSEYGTNRRMFQSIIDEANQLAESHVIISDRMHDEVQNTLKLWVKDHYHKTTFGQLKESKDFEEHFKKAQKPWSKLYVKMEKFKRDYHTACRQENSASNQLKNARADTSLSADQINKVADKFDRSRQETQKSREFYEKSLNDLNDYNSKYMEDMAQVFERCQEFERKRLKFFKTTMLNVHKCLDISQQNRMKEIYLNFLDTIQKTDDQQDLQWWSENFGPEMPMNWPSFHEYKPELRKIAKDKQKHQKENITLLATKPTEFFPLHQTIGLRQSTSENKAASNGKIKTKNGHMSKNNDTTERVMEKSDSFEDYDDQWDHNESDHVTSKVLDGNDSYPGVRNSISDKAAAGDYNDEQDEDDDVRDDNDGMPEIHHNTKGVAVKAMYDFIGQESDELSFKKGDIFEKLSDQNDQGWCTGRKDGAVGLYPTNYVEVIKN